MLQRDVAWYDAGFTWYGENVAIRESMAMASRPSSHRGN